MVRAVGKIMNHEAALIETLAISLAFAFVGGFLAAKLRDGAAWFVAWLKIPGDRRS